jgi:hypothetical protein
MAGGREQVTALLARDPATHASLDVTYVVDYLLSALRQEGAQGRAEVLTDRLPGAGTFRLFRDQEARQERFQFGGKRMAVRPRW